MWTFTLIILVIVVLVLGAVALLLLKQRMSPPVFRALANDEFPAHAMDQLQPMARELAALGMVFSELRHEQRSTGEDSWQAVFHNEDRSVWAVCETYVVAKQDRTRMVLQSFSPDGSVVITSNDTFADISVPPNWRLIQKSFDNCAEQMKAHRSSILGMGRAAERIHRIQSPSEFREYCSAVSRSEHQHLREKGYFVSTASDPNTFRFSWLRIPWLTLRVLWMAIVVRPQAKNSQNQPGQATPPGVPDPNATPGMRRLELYRQETEQESLFGKLGWTGKGLVFLVSMIAFMAFFYFRGTLELSTLGWVVVILIIHEAGHALTMRLFGYRDVQIFFIPFFGAAASGTKKRVPAWQEFWVSIMGPLPGLVAGWIIMGWAILQPDNVPAWLEEFALWSVIINGFNLLPFLPLDGGRIVETLIFNRLPTFRVVFIILGGIALLPLALLSWWFLFLAIIMFMTIPEASAMAGMSGSVRLNLRPEDTEDEALLKTFQIIEQTGNAKAFDKPTWPAFVDRIVQMGCGKRMGFLGTTAALGLYAMLIGLPLLLGIGVAFRAGWNYAEKEQELADRIVALEAKVTWPTTTVSKQTRALLDATEEAYWEALDEEDYLFDDSDEDLNALMRRSIAAQQDYDASFVASILPSVRQVRWNEAPAWIAEDESGARQELVFTMVQALIGEAGSRIAENKHKQAGRDLTIAYWAIASCEPRHSFSLWQDWLDLERQCLNAIEQVNAKGGLQEGTRTWIASTMRSAPRPTGSKVALLCLHDAGTIYTALDASMAIAEEEDPDQDGASSSDSFGWHTLGEMFVGGHIGEYLTVAAFWDSQPEATEIPPGEFEDPELAEMWNESIHRIQHILKSRELGALVLSGQADPAATPMTIGNKTITLTNDSRGNKWIAETADEENPDEVAWRIPEVPSPSVPEMTRSR